MKKENLFEQLRINRLMKSDKEADNFEIILFEISTNISLELEDIKFLCRGFDDNTAYRDIMHGLLHCVESIEKNDSYGYVEEILNDIDNFNPNAIFWRDVIISRILNNHVTLENLKNIMENNTNKYVNSISSILLNICKENHILCEKVYHVLGNNIP